MAQLLECGECCALLTAERMAVHEQTLHPDSSSDLATQP